MASKKRFGESERRQHSIGISSQLIAKNDKRVVRETQQRPGRAQPMRGSSMQPGKRLHDDLKMSTDQNFDVMLKAEEHAKMMESLCTQLLIDGYVQPFVDLFHIMRRDDQHLGGESFGESQQEINFGIAKTGTCALLDQADTEFLREQLVAAELCKRREETLDAMAAYDSIAMYFANIQDSKTMIYFYEKCLAIARHIKDPTSEMRLLRQIGFGYHAMDELEQARQNLELCVTIAKVVYEQDEEEDFRREMYTQLGKVYDDLALRHEQAEQFLAANNLHKLCMDCAIKSNNLEAQTLSQFKIGTCYNALNEPAHGLSFLEANLSAARQSGDFEGEGNACAALARAHEMLGNQQLSIEFLNLYLAIATRAGNVVTQADACAHLGQIYTASRNFQRAREMQEKNYDLIQALAARSGERWAQNISRVSVGAARANDKLATLLALVRDDYQGLLTWKTTRAVPTTVLNYL